MIPKIHFDFYKNLFILQDNKYKMIKLNKCRTLFKFDEAILASFLGQNQQTTEANKEETKEAQTNSEAPENDKTKTSSVAKDKTEADSATQKEAPEEETKKDSSSASENTQYLFFDADEFIITTYQSESGWWAGYKDTGDGNAAQKLGYFPSNYVQVIETYEVPTSNRFSMDDNFNIIKIATAEGAAENENAEGGFTWNDYAKYSYLDDNQVSFFES